MDITALLKIMAEKNASDLFFSVGAPFNIKINGKTSPLTKESLEHDQVKVMAYSIISGTQQKEFEKNLELNTAFDLENVGRYRINLYKQRGEVSMVIRHIKLKIPGFEELHLPPILKKLIMKKRGLILVVGATGSGKSTTLAAMIDYRNTHESGHILTIEDPIEIGRASCRERV